jgi:hypothetical protein
MNERCKVQTTDTQAIIQRKPFHLRMVSSNSCNTARVQEIRNENRVSKSYKVTSDSHTWINRVNSNKLLHQLSYVAEVAPVAMVVVAVVSTMCRGNVKTSSSSHTVTSPAFLRSSGSTNMCRRNVQDLLLPPSFELSPTFLSCNGNHHHHHNRSDHTTSTWP